MIKLIAIDPGASNGGISMMEHDGSIFVTPIPKDLREFYRMYGEILSKVKDNEQKPLTGIEYIGIMPSDLEVPGKIHRIKILIEHYAQLRGFMDAMGFEYYVIHPRTWQAFHQFKKIKGESLKDRKNRYKAHAQVLFPEVKVTAWNQDSLLILDFMFRKLLAGEVIAKRRLNKKSKEATLF